MSLTFEISALTIYFDNPGEKRNWKMFNKQKMNFG